jgi:hypothetical protein
LCAGAPREAGNNKGIARLNQRALALKTELLPKYINRDYYGTRIFDNYIRATGTFDDYSTLIQNNKMIIAKILWN